MKKLTIISLVLVLLAVSVVPVMAGNGNGNGGGVGHGNSGGNKEKSRDTEQDKTRDRERIRTQNMIREKKQDKWMSTPFYLQGEITAVDAMSTTLYVSVVHANAKVKDFIGDVITITVTESTMIFRINQGGDDDGTGSTESDGDDNGGTGNRVPITFADLAPGQKVAIHGRLMDELFTARLITVYIRAPLDQGD